MKVKVVVPAVGDHRFKQWAKRLKGVDVTKSNGYAFEGEFVTLGRLTEEAQGTLFLFYGEEGSVKQHSPCVYVKSLQGEDTWETIFEAHNLNPAWALEVRDDIAKLISEQDHSEGENIAGIIALYILQQRQHGDIRDAVVNPHAGAAWELADRLGVWTQVAEKVELAIALEQE
jgi:Neuraminidase (sialidase)